MIRKIYNKTKNNSLIIELENRRLLTLSRTLAQRVSKNYCHKLENVNLATVANIPKEKNAQEIIIGKRSIGEIYDIISSNGNYYLLFMDGEVRSEATIIPGELKILLNCFKKEKPTGLPWDDGRI